MKPTMTVQCIDSVICLGFGLEAFTYPLTILTYYIVNKL